MKKNKRKKKIGADGNQTRIGCVGVRDVNHYTTMVSWIGCGLKFESSAQPPLVLALEMLYIQLCEIYPEFIDFNDEEKMKFILSCTVYDVLKLTSSYIYDIEWVKT